MKQVYIAGRLPENSRNSFLDLQSRKNSKKDKPKNSLFFEGWDVIFWLRVCISYFCLLINFHLEWHIHLTLSFWIKINKSQFQSEEVIFKNEVKSRVTKNLITRMNQKNSLH